MGHTLRGRVWAGAALAPMRAGGPRTQARAYGLPAGGFGRTRLSGRAMGKPGFPIRSPRERVWEGVASQKQRMFILFVCGVAA